MSFEELSAWERDQVARATIDELHANDAALFERARAAVPAPWSWPERLGISMRSGGRRSRRRGRI